jgi:hypothetical protein
MTAEIVEVLTWKCHCEACNNFLAWSSWQHAASINLLINNCCLRISKFWSISLKVPDQCVSMLMSGFQHNIEMIDRWLMFSVIWFARVIEWGRVLYANEYWKTLALLFIELPPILMKYKSEIRENCDLCSIEKNGCIKYMKFQFNLSGRLYL